MSARIAPGGAVIKTRKSLPARAVRFVRAWWIRQQIRWTEDWIEDCRRDDLHKSLNLVEFDRQLQALRVELSIVENS